MYVTFDSLVQIIIMICTIITLVYTITKNNRP